MTKEILANEKGAALTLLQLLQEILAMEFIYLFHISKNNVTLASESLRNIFPQQLRNVILKQNNNIKTVAQN
jgi:hypothetical protein